MNTNEGSLTENVEVTEANERTPLLGSYTPRELLESHSLSRSQRSWRETSSYIARQSYYSRLSSNTGGRSLVVPYHVLAQYLVHPALLLASDGKTQSSLVTVFAIWNTMMGTSMLAMSYGINQAGFALGLFLIIGLGIITFYTANRVARSKYHVDRSIIVFEFPDICRVFLGRFGEQLAGIFGIFSFLGALLAYWVYMSTFLRSIGDFIHEQITNPTPVVWSSDEVICLNGAKSFRNSSDGLSTKIPTTFDMWWSEKTVPIYLIFIFLPILNLKDAVYFTKFNSLGTISVFYVTFLSIYKSAQWGVNWSGPTIDDKVSWEIKQFSPNFPDLMAMLCLSFFIHSAVITLLKNHEKPERNTKVLSMGYFLVGLTYSFIGGLLFLTFPDNKDCIGQNILENLLKNDVLAIIARFFLFLQMGTVFPLLIFIFRVQFLYVIFKVKEFPGFLKVLLLNTITVTVCTIVSITYPKVADIIGWSGAVCGLVYIFLLPCLVSIMIKRRNGTITTPYYLIHGSLIVLGFAILIAKIAISVVDS